MPYKIDLHIHSNLSDSTLSPKEIIDDAASKGMVAIAITDHDTFAVTKELQAYAKAKGLTLIPGIEISCMDETTKRKVHILGYGFNDQHVHINQLLAPFKHHVTSQRLKLIPILNEMGFMITKEEVLNREILYKQDLAIAMVNKGYGEYKEIFTTYFFGPNSIEKQYSVTFNDVKKTIEAIHKDGGIAVLAHPRTYNTFDEIDKYIGWGLDGIEICHPSFIDGDLKKIIHYPLLHFGGSDNHGQLNLTRKRVIGDYGITIEDYQKIKDRIDHSIENDY